MTVDDNIVAMAMARGTTTANTHFALPALLFWEACAGDIPELVSLPNSESVLFRKKYVDAWSKEHRTCEMKGLAHLNICM
jgi:hypothetical protein